MYVYVSYYVHTYYIRTAFELVVDGFIDDGAMHCQQDPIPSVPNLANQGILTISRQMPV